MPGACDSHRGLPPTRQTTQPGEGDALTKELTKISARMGPDSADFSHGSGGNWLLSPTRATSRYL